MRHVFLGCLIGILVSVTATSQTTDLARIEYLHIPFSKSDNSINRFRVLGQLPIPLTKDKEKRKFLVIGAEYRYIDLNIEEPVPFDPSLVSSVQRIEGSIGYVTEMGNNWLFGAEMGARINSTLQDSPSGDDFIYEGSVYFIKDVDAENSPSNKEYRLILGLTYSTTPGRNYPLPLINYHRKFRENMTYTIGVPKSNIRYYMNASKKDAIQAFATLDNFFGNIQQNIQIPDTDVVAENISMTNVLAGIGYEHFFTKHLLYYAYFAHTLYSEFRLRDNNRETAYIIENDNSLYFRSGVKFKF